MYSPTVASGLDFGGGGLGLTLNPIGQARERRSSIYGSTEKVFAGLLERPQLRVLRRWFSGCGW